MMHLMQTKESSIVMKEFNYNALVLVHPDFGRTTQNTNFKENLSKSINFLEKKGIPIFHLGGCIELVKGIRELLSNTIDIPVIDHHYETDNSKQEREDFQTEVDFISGKLGKNSRDITLGFGGTYASACVYYYAIGWCKEVETKYLPKEQKANNTCQDPCKFGKVIDDLV